PIDFDTKLAKGEAPSAPASSPQGIIETAGAKYDGTTMDLDGTTPMHWFTDPQTGSTLLLKGDEVTPENVALHLKESRAAWGIGGPSAGQIGGMAAGAAAGAALQG